MQTDDEMKIQAVKRYLTLDGVIKRNLETLYNKRHEYIQEILVTETNMLVTREFRTQHVKALRLAMRNNMGEIMKIQRAQVRLRDKQNEKKQLHAYERLLEVSNTPHGRANLNTIQFTDNDNRLISYTLSITIQIK